MSTSYFDSSSDPRIQLAVAKAERQFAEEKLSTCKQDLEKADLRSDQLKFELKQMTEKRENLKIDLGVTKQHLTHTQEALDAIKQEKKKKSLLAKGMAFFVSLLFLGVSAISGIGVNELTATPPNPSLGWVMMSIAATTHVVATLITIFLDLGG